MTSSGRSKGSSKQEKVKETNENLKQQTQTSASDAANANLLTSESRILAELEKLRAENREGHEQTKLALTKLESSMGEMKAEMTKLEKRITETEGRISTTEDNGRRYENAIRYLLRREIDLTARCEDLQNRSRRNNLRIYRVPEGSEGKDVKVFVKELLHSALQPMPEVNLQIERAHRSLIAKPKDPIATPRSLIVKFVDYSVKDAILRQAWSQKQVLYKTEQIYFDHDYSPELQKKRAQVREVIKHLKQKDIKAKCIYPAQLKIFTGSGEKTYPTLADALLELQELGIRARMDEREQMERELSQYRWTNARGRRGKDPAVLTGTDIRAFFSGAE
ncbi:hypothetical protein NFI96_002484 [Prochilodus magdalenae]|nr:hypothetical protein NFI96_002484 [Prochilodus magdalenae]